MPRCAVQGFTILTPTAFASNNSFAATPENPKNVFAGLTFSLKRIGTVSVLAACLLFVSIFALTNREKYNVTNVYGSIEVHKRRTDGDH